MLLGVTCAWLEDGGLLQLAFRRFYKAFLRAGIEIYEYQPQIVHAKLIIADGDIVVVFRVLRRIVRDLIERWVDVAQISTGHLICNRD